MWTLATLSDQPAKPGIFTGALWRSSIDVGQARTGGPIQMLRHRPLADAAAFPGVSSRCKIDVIFIFNIAYSLFTWPPALNVFSMTGYTAATGVWERA